MPSDQSHICRRLILLLDGTWNEDNDKQPATNIVYLRERLFWGLQTRLRHQEAADRKASKALPESHAKKATSGFVFDGFEYIVYYDRGVGTGAYLDPIMGGIAGTGLDHNIRKAYKFLSQWFRPGDEIFIFGFSRGAFTARSLCGYLQAVGLLRAELCDAENEARAWNFYRTPPADRLSADWLHFRQSPGGTPLVHSEDEMRVRALGVFDTVGALGVPAVGFRRINRAKYEFHDTDVNSLVDIRLHAVAIDEPRWAFEPAPWTKPKFKIIDQKKSPTEQVWFAGAHADIGGGYVKWNQDERGLSHVPLAWMLQRLEYHLVNTPPLAAALPLETAVLPQRNAPIPFYAVDLLSPDPAAPGHNVVQDAIKSLSSSIQHKPWALVRGPLPDACRIINQLPLPKLSSIEAVGRVPHSDPIGEMIHVSALERMRSDKPITIDKGRALGLVDTALRALHLSDSRYAPRNLTGVIPYIAATYLQKHGVDTQWKNFVDAIFSWKEILVVDWDGRPLDPALEPDVQRVFKLLPTPEAVHVREMPPEMKLILMPSARRRFDRAR
jgi:type VI secretion system (T6SS) phospholipase Tle1-like effector